MVWCIGRVKKFDATASRIIDLLCFGGCLTYKTFKKSYVNYVLILFYFIHLCYT